MKGSDEVTRQAQQCTGRLQHLAASLQDLTASLPHLPTRLPRSFGRVQEGAILGRSTTLAAALPAPRVAAGAHVPEPMCEPIGIADSATTVKPPTSGRPGSTDGEPTLKMGSSNLRRRSPGGRRADRRERLAQAGGHRIK